MARLPPGVELGGVGVDAADLLVLEPMHGKTLLSLPTLDGPHAAPQVSGDPLPGVETALGHGVIL